MISATKTSSHEQVEYLRSLKAIRQRSATLFRRAEEDLLQFWILKKENERLVVERCISLLSRDYGQDYTRIPPHSRWRHLDANGIHRIDWLLQTWELAGLETQEQNRRLIELFIIAVLLDAGAGNTWTFTEHNWRGDLSNTSRHPEIYRRSEGLAVATFHMFRQGIFSSDPRDPMKVDAHSLINLSIERLRLGFQCDNDGENDIAGLEGRLHLLNRLGECIQRNESEIFVVAKSKSSTCRLGNLLDHILSKAKQQEDSSLLEVGIDVIWSTLLNGLSSIWPDDRIVLDGCALGDVWHCQSEGQTFQTLVPFHKLTQWMTYSLLEVFEKVIGLTVAERERLTGLPEYRNGGLFVDMNVLEPRKELFKFSNRQDPSLPPLLDAKHPAVVEWRAMTIILLDRVHAAILQKLQLTPTQLSLAQVLEACTWKAGRECAQAIRPKTGAPPVEVISDGTIF